MTESNFVIVYLSIVSTLALTVVMFGTVTALRLFKRFLDTYTSQIDQTIKKG